MIEILLPLGADIFSTIVFILIMTVSFITWVANKIAEFQQKNAGPKKGQGGDVQNEIERFLREVTGEGKKDGEQQPRRQPNRNRGEQSARLEQRQAAERQKREQQERREQPKQSLRERSQQRDAERTRAEAQRKSERNTRLGGRDETPAQPQVKVVREGRRPKQPHRHSESNRVEVESTVAEDAQSHLPHLVSGIGTTAANTPVPTVGSRTSLHTPTAAHRRNDGKNEAFLALLRNRDEIKKAMVMNEVLAKPLAMRKRST